MKKILFLPLLVKGRNYKDALRSFELHIIRSVHSVGGTSRRGNFFFERLFRYMKFYIREVTHISRESENLETPFITIVGAQFHTPLTWWSKSKVRPNGGRKFERNHSPSLERRELRPIFVPSFLETRSSFFLRRKIERINGARDRKRVDPKCSTNVEPKPGKLSVLAFPRLHHQNFAITSIAIAPVPERNTQMFIQRGHHEFSDTRQTSWIN